MGWRGRHHRRARGGHGRHTGGQGPGIADTGERRGPGLAGTGGKAGRTRHRMAAAGTRRGTEAANPGRRTAEMPDMALRALVVHPWRSCCHSVRSDRGLIAPPPISRAGPRQHGVAIDFPPCLAPVPGAPAQPVPRCGPCPGAARARRKPCTGQPRAQRSGPPRRGRPAPRRPAQRRPFRFIIQSGVH
jgi:hypothetical protein